MKAVILAGGFGTRISEESHLRPKPMVEIGGFPILWHIMKLYGEHDVTEFVVCCGYKGYMIKEYFANYFLHMSDVTIDFSSNDMQVHNRTAEPWKVTLVDTGAATQTGGRIKRVGDYLGDTFCLTYGDGLSDVNICEAIAYHKEQGREATMTAIQPPGRYGALSLDGNLVEQFEEKPRGDRQWINGGFMVCEKTIIDRITDDNTVFEKEPLDGLAKDKQLAVWKHEGFWQSMDTLRDKEYLESLWKNGDPPWRTWA